MQQLSFLLDPPIPDNAAPVWNTLDKAQQAATVAILAKLMAKTISHTPVSNSERGYHVFSDVGTKLEFVGFNEAVHVRVATDIFSRIGLTRCLSDPYIPSAGCGNLIS